MSLLHNPQPSWYGKDGRTSGMAEASHTQFERIIVQLRHMPRWLQAAVVLLLLAFSPLLPWKAYRLPSAHKDSVAQFFQWWGFFI